jgi:hypothetical protein
LELSWTETESLVGKWLSIGREETLERKELDRQTFVVTERIMTALATNAIQPLPLYVLIFLQEFGGNGVFGEVEDNSLSALYSLLVKHALGRAKPAKGIPAKVRDNFLYGLAYHLYLSNKNTTTDTEFRTVSDAEFSRFHAHFMDRYGLEGVPLEKLANIFSSVRILERLDGGYRFRFPPLFYLFVARYLADNISKESERNTITAATSKPSNPRHARMLVFLSGLTRDALVVSELVGKVKNMCSDVEPCRFDDDVKWLSVYTTSLGKVEVPENPQEVRREAIDVAESFAKEVQTAVRDKVESTDNRQRKSERSVKAKEVDEVYGAMRMVEILGQVLTRHWAGLEADVKEQITLECYMLGLRLCRRFLLDFEKKADDMMTRLCDAIEKDQPKLKPERRLKQAKIVQAEALVFMVLGAIWEVANAVGTSRMGRTYDAVRDNTPTPAVRLIDAHIRLRMSRKFPEKKIIALARDLRRKQFATYLLRRVVSQHFVLYPVDRSTRERICKKLQIKLTAPG